MRDLKAVVVWDLGSGLPVAVVDVTAEAAAAARGLGEYDVQVIVHSPMRLVVVAFHGTEAGADGGTEQRVLTLQWPAPLTT
jgi:hypothetical protein